MNCEKASEAILAGSQGGAELDAHLAGCPECASLARQWNALKEVKCDLRASAEPPVETDLRICSAALARAHEARLRKRFFKVVISFAAAAAMLAVSATLAFSLLNGEVSSKAPGAASASPQRFAALQTIAWDSVELSDGLLSLSSEIESASSELGAAKASSSDSDDVFPKISVEVPDLAT